MNYSLALKLYYLSALAGDITAFRQGGKEHVLAEKDITEKLLEDYGDVFSDIVNGFIFYGKPVVTEDELTDIHTVSQYKAFDGKLHGEERDVAKRWKQGVVNIAVLGIENQSEILHVDEVLKFISAVTKDRRYEAIIEDDSENKEVRTMCDVAERLEQRGIAKGITQGERLGVIKTLKELVTDKILTVSDAAKRAGMSVSDFKTAAGIVADR